ncbi:MAG: hypothetical protein ABIN13_17200 [Mucilaginibacter sp.]
MKRVLCYALIVIAAISACRQKPKKVFQKAYNPDETNLTTLAAKTTVEPGTMFKSTAISMQSAMLKYAIPLYKLTKKEIDSGQRHIDTLKKMLDTSKIFILIADTLLKLPDNYLIKYLKGPLKNEVTDTTDRYIESFLKDIKINTDGGKINLTGFKSPYNYTCILESNVRPSTKLKFIAGRFAMSAINFNPARNKALIYTTYSCGGLCGSGQDLYFEKKSGKWVLIKRVTLWVS